jgi:FtsZ-binding cell division protein ZapB
MVIQVTGSTSSWPVRQPAQALEKAVRFERASDSSQTLGRQMTGAQHVAELPFIHNGHAVFSQLLRSTRCQPPVHLRVRIKNHRELKIDNLKENIDLYMQIARRALENGHGRSHHVASSRRCWQKRLKITALRLIVCRTEAHGGGWPVEVRIASSAVQPTTP